MPDFWQFPTVSMGLGPLMSHLPGAVQPLPAGARLGEWTRSRRSGRSSATANRTSRNARRASRWRARENLDNLIWVVNCNLQRLDGPVRGNGKIIQELEGLFRGAGWNVIKVIWGSRLGRLARRATSPACCSSAWKNAVDGDYQKYSVEPGSYTRKHFFGKYPELLELVNHLTDEQIRKLLRGGHDARKVYAAYKAAVEHKGQPTVILAKTVKGYGLGEAGEGRNISHQQKKMNEKELREFRERFDIPISDEVIAETPFFRPPPDSAEIKYLLERRKELGGFLPARVVKPRRRSTCRSWRLSREFFKGVGTTEISTTMAFVRLLCACCCGNKSIGRHIVPIIPDEARTFGLDALFREIGIYSSKGQLYEPVDKQVAALLSRGQGRADSGGRHHRGRFDGVVHRGRHELRHAWRADDSVLHLLLDVRLRSASAT